MAHIFAGTVDYAMIRVYRFEDAPNDLKETCSQGGDEDWIVLITAAEAVKVLEHGVPFWIEVTDSCREPKRIDLGFGDVAFVGCH